MPATEQIYPTERRIFEAREADSAAQQSFLQPPTRTRWARAFGQEWAPALLFVLLDVGWWVTTYALITSFRRDAFYVTPLEFFFINLVQLVVIVQALYIIGGYDRHVEMRSLSYTTEHILAMLGAAVVSSFVVYSVATFAQAMKPSRGGFLFSFVVFAPASLIYRRLIRRALATSTSNHAFLVVGCGEPAARLYDAYRNSSNRQRLCFVDYTNERVGQSIAGEGSPLIEGDFDGKLRDPSARYSGIILAQKIKQLPPQLLERLVRTQFQRTRVYTLESFYESHWRYVPLDAIDPVWPLQTGFQLARISPYHYLKRLFDISVSFSALCLLAPIFALLAALIWILDGRPIFFSQMRVGRENESFTIYKFRTMTHRGSDAEGDIYTRANDPRITRLGRFLRKLRLDELPQFWNVLRGDMSLVGPRAEWVKCAEQYETAIPFYHFRHLVKPGITGWAQVNYPYGESDKDAIEKLKYDLYYIRHYSLKLDAMIFLKTIHTMLFVKGR